VRVNRAQEIGTEDEDSQVRPRRDRGCRRDVHCRRCRCADHHRHEGHLVDHRAGRRAEWGAHHPANEPGKAVGEYRLREVKFSYRIEGQDGTRFWGSLTSPYRTERLMGSIAADGKRIYMVDQDGFIDGVFIDPDTIDVCYREIKPDSAVVSCNIVRRDK
jgi:hypothetical protein